MLLCDVYLHLQTYMVDILKEKASKYRGAQIPTEILGVVVRRLLVASRGHFSVRSPCHFAISWE